MRTKITSIGSDCGIILERSILDALNIAPESEVEIRVEKDALIIRPIRDTHHNAVADAFQKLVDHPEEFISASSHWFG